MKNLFAVIGFLIVANFAISAFAGARPIDQSSPASAPTEEKNSVPAPQNQPSSFLEFDQVNEDAGDFQWHFVGFDPVPNPEEAFLLESARYAGGVLDCKDDHTKPHLYIYEANVFMRERGEFYFASKQQCLEVFQKIKAHAHQPSTFVIDTVDRKVMGVTIHLDPAYEPPRN